jgi:acyl-CoA reductase-like NAD-dependent aldehyde dehydrogenase
MPTTIDDDTGLEIVPLWIDGSPVNTGSAFNFAVFSAANQKKVFLAQFATPESAIEAADSAARAFVSWKRTSAVARRNITLKFVELIKDRASQIVHVQMEETSCSESWAKFNIDYTVNMVSEVAAKIATACTGELPPMANTGTFGMVMKEPIGPVLLIAP